MIGTPFLTAIDPRKRIKGSRDPLGLQPIWTQLGRRLIENLTTVTTSLPGFITLLQGLYFAQRTIQETSVELRQNTNLFLKYEQLAAYSRFVWNSDGHETEEELRGIRRVRKNVNEGKIRISARVEAQILSNQKTYGLWGLYTNAARESGWIPQNDPNNFLSAQARDFVEKIYLPRLPKNGDEILKFLQKDQDFDPKGKDRRLSLSIAETLSGNLSRLEKEFYHQHLICSNKTGIQERLWNQLRDLNRSRVFKANERFSFAELRELIKNSRKSGDNDLAQNLTDIAILETTFAPAGPLFAFLLGRDGQIVSAVASELRSHFGHRLNHIDPEEFGRLIKSVHDVNQDVLKLLDQLSGQLSEGRYNHVIMTLLEINRLVMKDRESDSWIKLKGDRLEVRIYDDEFVLPEKVELKDLWINTYFLNSFKSIGFQIWGK